MNTEDRVKEWQDKIESLIEERPELAELQADIDLKLSMCNTSDERVLVITLMLNAQLERLKEEFSGLKVRVEAISDEADKLTEGGYFDG